MATNNSGLDSNYLLVSEKRRKREEEKGIESELTGALAKRIQVENLYAGHPGFYRFRALGALHFSLEHSLACMLFT